MCRVPAHAGGLGAAGMGEGEVLQSQSTYCQAPKHFPRAGVPVPAGGFWGVKTVLRQRVGSDPRKGRVPSCCERARNTAG